LCVSLIFAGGLFGAIITMIFKIKKHNRLFFLIYLGIAQIALIFLALSSKNIIVIAIFLGLAFNCTFSLYINHMIIYFSENLSEDCSQIAITFSNMVWGFNGMLIVTFSWYMNGNIKTILTFIALCQIIFVFLLFSSIEKS
jgi:hypothetical protein